MIEFQPVDRPYPGLRPFEPHEAEIFFGRERHTDRLLAILQRERFLAVIGPSGSGKSSLVRAGLLPGLAMGSLGTGSDWRIALLRPGDRPMRSLAAALLQPQVLGRHLLAMPQTSPGEADIAALEAELRRGPQGLAQLVDEAQRRHREAAAGADASALPPPAFNLLVLVDQFEEIFTYADAGGRAAADESEAFIALLLAAAEQARQRLDQPGLYVALTMRTDFLGNCVRFADLPEAINQAQYLTPRLKRDEIERAIAGPAELWGGQIEPSLVAELINATGQSSDQLPLVQHALARMWAEALRRNPDAPRIDWDVAKAIGGVARAIEVQAQEIWNTLNPTEQFLVRGLFTAITERRSAESGGQAVRRPQTLARIADWLDRPVDQLRPLIERFAAPDVCFLQYRPPLTDDCVIDLSHEAIIRQWPALSGWVEEEAERGQLAVELYRRARQYRAGQTSLLTGADLARAWDWVCWGVAADEQEIDGRGPDRAWGQRYLGLTLFSDEEKKDLVEEVWESTDPRVLASARLSVTTSFVTESQHAVEKAQRAEAERERVEAELRLREAEARAQAEVDRARTELAERKEAQQRERANIESAAAVRLRRQRNVLTVLVAISLALFMAVGVLLKTTQYYSERVEISMKTAAAASSAAAVKEDKLLQSYGVSIDRLAEVKADAKLSTEIVRADELLQRSLNESAARIGREKIRVEYFAKNADEGRIEGGLVALGFQIIRKGSIVGENRTSNAIWFGRAAPLSDVKLVALTLLRAGIVVRAIRPIPASLPGKVGEPIVQVGADPAIDDEPPYLVEHVAAAANFDRVSNIFVHLGRADGSLADWGDLGKKITISGMRHIAGVDEQQDRFGPGVDYFYPVDRIEAERIAAFLNMQRPGGKLFVARSQPIASSSKFPPSTFGIWF